MEGQVSAESAQDFEPGIGSVVHIAGHGPAILVAADRTGRRRRYEVRYPDGSTYHVKREDILEHQALAPDTALDQCPESPSVRQAELRRRLVYLGRAFDDADRLGSMQSSIFSLVATMVGGGVLSLPYAMSMCGMVLGTLVLLLSGLASAWTLDMLVECARCTGRDTFELVGHAAFGEGGRKVTMGVVFVFCWLTMVAYFVLLADLLLPIVLLLGPADLFSGRIDILRKVVVFVAALLLSPMCFKDRLSALRVLCFASVGSVLFTALVIFVRASLVLGEPHDITVVLPDQSSLSVVIESGYTLWPENWLKALYVVPMFGVSFLCHFNALPTHQEIQQPTKSRMRRVLFLTMIFTSALYLFVGISGYLFAGVCTCGNILLNFAADDGLVACGRGALAIVLMLNFPLICQPCRNALFRLTRTIRCRAPADDTNGPGASLQPLPDSRVHVYRKEDTRTTTAQLDKHVDLEPWDSFTPKDEAMRQGAAEASTALRYGMTAALLGAALLTSMFLQSILVVWTITGSTVAFFVALIMPIAFWYRIVGPTARPLRRSLAVALLTASAAFSISCTVLTVLNLGEPPCPVL